MSNRFYDFMIEVDDHYFRRHALASIYDDTVGWYYHVEVDHYSMLGTMFGVHDPYDVFKVTYKELRQVFSSRHVRR